MGSSWYFENDPSCVVLYSLQLLYAVAWSAVEHSIAVVDPAGCLVAEPNSVRGNEVSNGGTSIFVII